MIIELYADQIENKKCYNNYTSNNWYISGNLSETITKWLKINNIKYVLTTQPSEINNLVNENWIWEIVMKHYHYKPCEVGYDEDFVKWFKENEMPEEVSKWSEEQKILFKLTWG